MAIELSLLLVYYSGTSTVVVFGAVDVPSLPL